MIGPSDITGAGGGSSGGGAAGSGEPVYVRGVHIDEEDPQVGGATCPNLVNDRDSHPQIEFIHFGRVHTSFGHRFPHDSYKDNVTIKPSGGATKVRPPVPIAKPRAIQFRSALEREAILLTVFIESAQTVLAEGEGMLAGLVSAAKSLIGGGGGGTSVKSSEMNAPLLKAISAAGKLNVASIEYHDTHKAGRDFHEARTDYRKLLAKVTGKVEKTAAQPQDDPSANAAPVHPDHQSALDHVKNAANSVKGAAANAASSAQSGARALMDIVQFAGKALLSKTDIKIMCFALVASQQERQIEQACHDMTLDAIQASTVAPSVAAARLRERQKELNPDYEPPADDSDISSAGVGRGNPFLPVWTAALDDAPPKESMLAPDRVGQMLNTFNTDPLGAAKTAFGNTVHNTLFGKNFFDVPEGVNVPGSAFMGPAFATAIKSINPADPEPMEVGELMVLGFSKIVGKNPLPKFAYELVLGVHERVAGVIQSIYDVLVKRPPDEEIRNTALIQGISPTAFASEIQSLTSSKLSALVTNTASQYSTASVSGIQVAHVSAINSEGTDLANKIEATFNEQATPVIIAAVKSAMGDLSRQLELARRDAKTTKAEVMEWYLGRAPYLQVDMFCSVFFPFWSIVMRCLMAALDGPSASALKSVLDAADKLNGVIQSTDDEAKQSARDAIPSVGDGGGDGGMGDEVGAAASQVKSAADRVGLSGPLHTSGFTDSGLSNLTDTSAIQSDIARNLTAPTLPITRGKFKLPFTSRIADGQGMDIEDYDEVKGSHQWDKALSPSSDDDAEDDADPADTKKPGLVAGIKSAASGPTIGAHRA